MVVQVQTAEGLRDIYVCDYCRTVCIGRRKGYCSSRCYHQHQEYLLLQEKLKAAYEAKKKGDTP